MQLKKNLKRVFKTIAIIYIIVGITIYIFQEHLIFHPQKLASNIVYQFSQSHTEVNIKTANNNSNIVKFQSTTNDSVPKGVVLYFHGNMTNISHYAAFAPYFTKHNYEVWMIDYPGFGKSTGPLSEQIIYTQAMDLYKMALAKGYTQNNIIIYGKSLGIGAASWLASHKNCKRLILETPYYSMLSLSQHYCPIYPVQLFTNFKFPVYEYLPKVSAPINIFHGDDDGTIPYSNSSKLKLILTPKDEFVTIPGGDHNNLYNFIIMKNKIDSLLSL